MHTATKALSQIRHLANLNEREALGWADEPNLRNRALGACSAYRNCAAYLERVIADDAAPELLAALENLLADFEGMAIYAGAEMDITDWVGGVRAAHAAIAKATSGDSREGLPAGLKISEV